MKISAANTAAAPIPGRQDVDLYFASLGQGVNPWLLQGARRQKLDRLYARTDKELAEMGLRREDIPAHVFGDLFS